MSGVSDEQVKAAREIELLAYLQANEPWELKRSGPGKYRVASHGSLVISSGQMVLEPRRLRRRVGA